MIHRVLFAGLPALALTACMVGPNYQRPSAPVPATYKELQGWKVSRPRDNADRGIWWSIYQDPELDELERQIDISNQNIQAAAAAYLQASALAREARSSLFPSVSLGLGATRQASSRGGASAGTTGAGGNTITNSSSGPQTSYNLESSASWDLDLWGKIRRGEESAVANAQASAAELASARLSAQASLATNYFNLRAADQLQHLLDKAVDAYKESLRITHNQYAAGVATRLDVITAQTQLQAAQAQAINVGVQRAIYEHAIAVLIGKPPAEFALAPGELTATVPKVPVAVPSTLLERRPDIAAAERQMVAANAQIGVADAAFYPDISLSALLGFVGSPLATLVSTSNRVWSLGAAASENLFNGGENSAAVSAAEAAYDESVANYRQTVLTAFQGVEDQLATVRILEQEAVVQDSAVQAAGQAVQISLNQYRAGTVTYTTVVTAQATLLADQQQSLTIQQNRLVASVTLIEDLGGGWTAAQLPTPEDVKKGKAGDQ
ncbi:MAG: efflux transporter outer membrane subunit [Gammaproteobacteria bacterium]